MVRNTVTIEVSLTFYVSIFMFESISKIEAKLESQLVFFLSHPVLRKILNLLHYRSYYRALESIVV